MNRISKKDFIEFMEDAKRPFIVTDGGKMILKIPEGGRRIFLYAGYATVKGVLSLSDSLDSAGIYDLINCRINGDCAVIKDYIDKDLIGLTKKEAIKLASVEFNKRIKDYAFANEKTLMHEYEKFLDTLEPKVRDDLVNNFESKQREAVEDIYVGTCTRISDVVEFYYYSNNNWTAWNEGKKLSALDTNLLFTDISEFVETCIDKNPSPGLYRFSYYENEHWLSLPALKMSQALGYELTSYYYRLKYIQELESGSNPILKKRHDIIKSAKAFIKEDPRVQNANVVLTKNGKSYSFKYPVYNIQIPNTFICNIKPNDMQKEIRKAYSSNEFELADIKELSFARKTFYKEAAE